MTTVQHPLNLILPIKSWLQMKELEAVLHLKRRSIADSADQIGTLHFARLFDFGENRLGFFTEYDGSFDDYMSDFLQYVATVFNAIAKRSVDGPPTPIEKNVDIWKEWTADRDLRGIGFYSAYPDRSVQDIRTSLGITKGSTAPEGQSPLALAFPIKSPNHAEALSRLLTESLPKLYAAADAVETVHFARFVPIGTTAMVLIAEYDGELEKLMQGLAKQLGPLLDRILEHVQDAPPTPVEKNMQAFTDWVNDHNLRPWVFYAGYPTASAKKIRESAKPH